MSIRINQKNCIGCGRCAEVCPGSLIRMRNGKADIRYEEDCWGCASCVKECRTGAIDFFLGADLGGGDVCMKVRKTGSVLNWDFYRENDLMRTITVKTEEANRY